MRTDEAFLRSILDDPEDDTPRLVYADWLDEQGDADRAEFIRVQVELARLAERDPRRPELQRRERNLIRRHKRAWLGVLPTGVTFLRFRRGFAEVKSFARAANYLKKGGRWHEQTPAPHLFRLQLTEAEDHLAAVLATPLMGRLVELSLYGSRVGDAGAALVAATPALHRLASLRLPATRIGAAGTRAVADSPWLTRLTELQLGFNPVGDVGATALAESPSLARLVELNLFSAGIGDVGALALARSPHLTRLARLHLNLNPIGEEGRRALRARFGSRVQLSPVDGY
jgi:uncharacterized protein (TIGR02996 family)